MVTALTGFRARARAGRMRAGQKCFDPARGRVVFFAPAACRRLSETQASSVIDRRIFFIALASSWRIRSAETP